MTDILAGRYVLDEKVSEGPLADVWRGHLRGDAGFARAVAVRVFREPYAKDRRFVGAWAAAATEILEAPSPHVEQVLDVVVNDQGSFVVSEWIDGLSLAKWLDAHRAKGEPVPWPLALEIAIESLRGLRDGHARTPLLCHDALGAGSVRLARDGTVKLTRFGASAALAATGAGRRRMEELGLRHAAPELVTGGSAEPATDLFGIGALLFEMLAGWPPYDAPPGQERDDAVVGEPPDLSAAREDVPPLLVALVERAMRNKPRQRYASAEEAIHALTQLARQEPDAMGPDALGRSVRAILDAQPKVAQRKVAQRKVAQPKAAQPKVALEKVAQPESHEDGSGPAALAASLVGMAADEARGEKKRTPTGLSTQSTMHVDAGELTELLEARAPTAEVVAPTSATGGPAAGATARAGQQEPKDDPKRYRFERKDRSASAAAEVARAGKPAGLAREDSEAAPVPLVTRPPKRPGGLSPAKTEFLDADQVDQLTVAPGEEKPAAKKARPLGLSAAKTEFLDEDQVDQLKIDE